MKVLTRFLRRFLKSSRSKASQLFTEYFTPSFDDVYLPAVLQDGSTADCMVHLKGYGSFLLNSFRSLEDSGKITSATFISTCRRYFLKLEFCKHPRKRNDLIEEGRIISHLNENGCQSCPQLYFCGLAESLFPRIPFVLLSSANLPNIGPSTIAMITSFVESNGRVPAGDLLFALLEQKGLGIFQGDIKPTNLAFDEANSRTFLLDYDQAIFLPDPVIAFKIKEFLDWSDDFDEASFSSNKPYWERHFPDVNALKKIKGVISDGKLDLSKLKLLSGQMSTRANSGYYHEVNNDLFSLSGVRSLADRVSLLDEIYFETGEKVLDVGCNLGLLSHYLYSRGCSVTGYELDGPTTVAAKGIANALNMKMRFFNYDLDELSDLESFDTVFLFSVIHHTRDLKINGKKIARSCKRVIIECRLSEAGKKPVLASDGRVEWTNASVWNYDSEADLHEGLEDLFPGFRVMKNYGRGDKGRMVIELLKDVSTECSHFYGTRAQ